MRYRAALSSCWIIRFALDSMFREVERMIHRARARARTFDINMREFAVNGVSNKGSTLFDACGMFADRRNWVRRRRRRLLATQNKPKSAQPVATWRDKDAARPRRDGDSLYRRRSRHRRCRRRRRFPPPSCPCRVRVILSRKQLQ